MGHDAPASTVLERSQRPWLDDPSLSMAERLAQAPSDGLVKGWLCQSIIENAKRHGVDLVLERRYFGFKDYPVREYLELLAQAAVTVRREEPAQRTLRVLGQGVYESFSQSLFGKVIMAGLGKGHEGARTGLRLIAHVYKRTSNHAIARFTEPADDVALVELSNVWSFPDAYHIGIFEGAARGFGGDVRVEIEKSSLSEASLKFQWLER
jgi:uncharacterized protein (TIGR02265 family)